MRWDDEKLEKGKEKTDPPSLKKLRAVKARGGSAMRIVALDLGAQQTSWCEVHDDKVIARGVIRDINELEELLGEDKAKVGFEACRESLNVHDWLTERGHEAVMLDTTKIRAIGVGANGRKNDRKDAEALALALGRGYASAAHVLSPLARELREHLEVHRALTQTRAQMVVHARGLAAGRGSRLPSCDTEHFVKRARSENIPEPVFELINGLLDSIEVIQRELGAVDTRIDALLAEQEDPVVERLASVPGVSLLVSAAFISVVDDPTRFKNASQVAAYLGLCPSEKTTGGKQRLGSITKRGNPYARWMLVQAAWAIIRSRNTNDSFVRWSHRVCRRRGRMRGAVAVARRLARLLWAMWRDGTYYAPQGIRSGGTEEEKARQAANAHRQAVAKLTRQRRQNAKLTN